MNRRVVAATALPGAGMVLAMQLEWVRLGSAGRNSYEMFRSAQRLGLDQLTPFRVVWFVLPVLCLGAVLTVGLDRRGTAAFFLGVASTISVGVGLAVVTSGAGAGLGAPLAVFAGGVGLVSVGVSVGAAVRERRRPAAIPTAARGPGRVPGSST